MPSQNSGSGHSFLLLTTVESAIPDVDKEYELVPGAIDYIEIKFGKVGIDVFTKTEKKVLF